jgi:hypothetical protein
MSRGKVCVSDNPITRAQSGLIYGIQDLEEGRVEVCVEPK